MAVGRVGTKTGPRSGPTKLTRVQQVLVAPSECALLVPVGAIAPVTPLQSVALAVGSQEQHGVRPGAAREVKQGQEEDEAGFLRAPA